MNILATSTLSKPVISTANAETIATITDLIYDLADRTVCGFEVLAPDGKYVLPVGNIKSASDTQFLVESIEALVPHEDAPELTAELMRGAMLHEVEVKTTEDVMVGMLHDLVIDLSTWTITGFQVNRGSLSDAMLGNAAIPAVAAVTISPILLHITPEMALSLQNEGEQLLSSSVQSASETAGNLLKKGQALLDGLIS